MADFITTVNRVASELRRSNLATEIKNAVNDAIADAARDRFYFNEVKGATFNTVAGTEYYADPADLVEIDAMYYLVGTTRFQVFPENNLLINEITPGTAAVGPPLAYSRAAGQLRLYPVPDAIYTLYVDGYGRLTPSPLTGDTDTNAWLTDGERYIRAKAKAIILKDVIRDFGEAAAYEAIAEDYRTALVEATTLKIGTGTLIATEF